MKRFLLIFHSFLIVNSAGAQIATGELSKGTEKVPVEDIIIVFKMHFDIGFTDWAESILQKYTTLMMKETLQSVEATRKLPKEDQFVWTLPGWPMKYILENTSPEYKKGVEDALRAGNFRVHAFPGTLETESSDLETLVRGMSYSSEINRKYGHPLPRGAKLTDVPSHSWVLPTLLKHAGVDILHIGCNAGSTSPDVPTVFWWEGPDGSRLLTFNWAEYYGSGVLPPSGWKYKTWLAMIHTHENTGAPSPRKVEAVLKEAREKVPGARVRVGQLEDFYDALMKENPSIPVVKGDMPDTWIHGYMSMPKEVKINKSMQRVIYNTETLNTLLNYWGVASMPVNEYVDKAIEQSVLFDEHTFGLAMTHGNQAHWTYGDEFVIKRSLGEYDLIEESWYEKGNRAHRAQECIIPSLKKDLKTLAGSVQADGRKVVVYNPLPWERSGVVSFHLGVYRKNFEVKGIKDEITGDIYPVENDNNTLTFFARNIPSMGYKTYTVLTESAPDHTRTASVDEANAVLENKYFKLTINKKNGALLSVWDKKQKKEMVDTDSEYGFGEYVHERFGMEEIDRYNNNYVKPGQHGWASPEMGRPVNSSLKYKMDRGTLSRIVYNETPVYVRATSFCRNGEGNYTLTYTLYEDAPYVEICWGVQDKHADPQPEGGWLAFPFNVSKPTFHLGRTGAIVNPATDFVKNTNHDYFFLNTGMAVVDNKGNGFGLNTPHAPAVSLGRPGLYRFSGEFIPKEPNVFVNLFNTQWGTNFTEWIDGSLSAKVYLWSADKYDNESSLITPTEETRVPLMGVYAQGKGGALPLTAQGIGLSRKGVLVTAFGPNTDGEGDVLRLWEQAGKKGKCTVTLPDDRYTSAQVCNLRGEPLGETIRIKDGALSVELQVYSPVSLILKK